MYISMFNGIWVDLTHFSLFAWLLRFTKSLFTNITPLARWKIGHFAGYVLDIANTLNEATFQQGTGEQTQISPMAAIPTSAVLKMLGVLDVVTRRVLLW